jgi:hypothetical protein
MVVLKPGGSQVEIGQVSHDRASPPDHKRLVGHNRLSSLFTSTSKLDEHMQAHDFASLVDVGAISWH